MPADPIDRREAKKAIKAAIVKCKHEREYNPACVNQRHFAEVAIAALDKLPAHDADGRWEKLRTFVECQTRKVGPVEIFIAAYEEVLKEMDRLTSGDAAKREG